MNIVPGCSQAGGSEEGPERSGEPMKSGLPLYDAAEAAIAAFYAHAGETFQAIDRLEDMVEVVRGLQQCQHRLIHIEVDLVITER